MRTCCGQTVRTPFCPYCGRVFYNANGLEGLLAHIQRHVLAFEKRAEKLRLRFKDDPEKGEEKANQWCGAVTQRRWKEWEEALIKVMKEE
jgi:hypothetical protein